MSDSVFDQNNVVDENYMIDQDKLPDGQPGQQSTSSQAVDEAKSVAADAASSGKAVAGAAKEEVAQVAGEAKNHAQDLYHQARSEVSSQAATQQDRLAGLLRLLTSELQEMGRSSQSGIASGLVSQAADQTERVAGCWSHGTRVTCSRTSGGTHAATPATSSPEQRLPDSSAAGSRAAWRVRTTTRTSSMSSGSGP